MFKKFKDKLAEEVKSSPQRLHQFAQAAQAAVTSASSSISDITNNDLFSIGDNDSSNKSQVTQNTQPNVYPVTSLATESMNVNMDSPDFQINENQRLRRLSNSSFSSDISFRLPSYESPSMYHLQSDMEVSASEAEEKSPFGGMVNLDRVTKEQLYAAYRRTQDRCKKYKTQYSDLARHYKLLERENAKARNVLVETQDKALRRISELREQCSLEQSAKAHLEQVLRTEIEEKNMKIESLNTNLSLLQSNNFMQKIDDKQENQGEKQTADTETQLINFEINKESAAEMLPNEITILNNKMEKMEQLLNKYKESLKVTKEKNSQLTIDMSKIAAELENKSKENDCLKADSEALCAAKNNIDELKETIEHLQNEINSLEFLKNKETSILEMNLKNAQEEIINFKNKIEILSKREEEYAISLAENKLSIHKELESKEAEIKALKISLSNSESEIKCLESKITDYTTSIDELEKEKLKLKNGLNELESYKAKITEYQTQLEIITEKCKSLESTKNKSEEEYKCLQLQLKQEAAEKLAMIDRNVYLENRNAQLLEENSKKNNRIKDLENELQISKDKECHQLESTENTDAIAKLNEQLSLYKTKCTSLESEIRDEKIELEKLQAEIEKLLQNYQHVQKENNDINIILEDLKNQNFLLQSNINDSEKLILRNRSHYNEIKLKFADLRTLLNSTSEETKSLKSTSMKGFIAFNEQINILKSFYKKVQDRNLSELDNTKLQLKSIEDELYNKSEQCLNAVEELNRVKKDNENLLYRIEQNNNIILNLQEEINTVKSQQHVKDCELQKITDESKTLQETISQASEEKIILSDQLNIIKEKNSELLIKLEIMGKNKDNLNYNFEKNMLKLKDTEERLDSLSKKYEDLLNIKRDYDEKVLYVSSLEKEIENLKSENSLLKDSSERISKSLDEIEIEMKELKLSHLNIEKEKDYLNTIIKKLDESSNKSVEHRETQSESVDLEPEQIITSLESEKNNTDDKTKTIESLKEELKSLLQINHDLSEKVKVAEILSGTGENNKDNNLLNECELLKLENKRLQSDIEGLQIYMTKVSKENDELNNKMRELIASGENISEKNNIENIKEDTMFSNKEKIEHLLRENNLLVEENLELKDQIQSQVSNRHEDFLNRNNERDGLKSNQEYEKLVKNNAELKIKLKDLEEMNYTVNSDMLKLQENNKKLKLSNEKLERKLDEALVSLRHLHSLQENTELEYLKNILFEYLTGSGTHSYTLAKVLAAVVKFDDKQTDIVLQKEKERQGVLRQLGII